MKTSRPINRLRTVYLAGAILREPFLAPLGMSANELSLALSVPGTRIHAILKARRGVSADTAERQARYFGVVLQRFELVTCQLVGLSRSMMIYKPRMALHD